MSNPAITGSMTLRCHSAVIKLSTTSLENILGNAAGSSKLIEYWLSAINSDGTDDSVLNAYLYDQDGTPMNSQAGEYQAAIGADAVDGSAIGPVAPTDLEVTAGGGQVVIDKLSPLFLHENQSVVVQASDSNRVTILLSWIVKG